MSDPFFIAFCLLFAGLFLWAVVKEYAEGWIVRLIMRASSGANSTRSVRQTTHG